MDHSHSWDADSVSAIKKIPFLRKMPTYITDGVTKPSVNSHHVDGDENCKLTLSLHDGRADGGRKFIRNVHTYVSTSMTSRPTITAMSEHYLLHITTSTFKNYLRSILILFALNYIGVCKGFFVSSIKLISCMYFSSMSQPCYVIHPSNSVISGHPIAAVRNPFLCHTRDTRLWK
jgi:hypothetical protein